MAEKDYKLNIYRRTPRPRSDRLREAGYVSTGGVSGSGGVGSDILAKLSLVDKFASWFYEDEATGDIYLAKRNEVPRSFISFGEISAGGKSGGGDVPAGVTKLSALEDVSLSDLSTGQVLKYDGSKWVNAEEAGGISSLTINLGTVSYEGVGTTDVVVNLPAYPTSMAWGSITGKPSWIGSTKPSYAFSEITGKPSWIGSTKPSYAFSEITGKPTTISGYGITDAYTKQTVDDKIAALQSAINVINSWFTLSDGTLITTYNIAADGEVSAGGQSSGGGGGTGGLIQTVYGYSSLGGTFSDNNKNDTFNAYTINTLASRIGVLENTPSGISSLTVNLGTVSYVGTGTTDVTVSLPAYPTTLPASDVYAWAKQPNKPSYTFSEIGSKPSTLSGYGITDAYSKTDADNRYLQLSGGTMSGDITMTGHALVWDDQTAYDNVPTGLMGVSVVNDSELGYSTAISFKNYYGLQIAMHGAGNHFYVRGHNHTQWKSWYKLLHTGNIGSYALTPSNYTSTLDGRYVKKSGDTINGVLYINNVATSGGSFNEGLRINRANTSLWATIAVGGASGSTSGTSTGTWIFGASAASRNYNLIIAENGSDDNSGLTLGGNGSSTLTWKGSTIWHSGNDGSGSGLDADLLDGYHGNAYLLRSGGTMTGNITMSNGLAIEWKAGLAEDYNMSRASGLRIDYAAGSTANTPISGAYGSVLSVLPNYYGFQIAQSMSNATINWRYQGGYNTTSWSTWKTIVDSDNIGSYNAGSATKLQTARTIWGQSFNGTANVSGSLTGVTTITASGLITANGGVQIGPTAGVRVSYVNSYLSLESRGNEMCIGGTAADVIYINYRKPSGGYAPAMFLWKAGSSSSWANFTLGSITANGKISADGTGTFGGTLLTPEVRVFNSMSTADYRLNLNWEGEVARIYAVANDSSLSKDLILGSTAASRGLYYDASTGRWGIGTTAPAMKLHVVGDARFDGWIYSYNQTGWYNSTYGGGIYMTDGTYVRVYNGKAFYVANNIVATGEVSAGNASDRRLKKDISTLSERETEHVLSALNPVSFVWNEKAEELSNGRKRGIAYSFVADEFLSLLPNAGRKMWNEYDAIYTEQVVPYVVKGWQMHERRLSDHERRIQELEKENKELKRQLRRVA